ncbi:MAG: ABC transporter substrate-binding protein [Anaerolineaceae bacterium]
MDDRYQTNLKITQPTARVLLGAALILLFIVGISACQGISMPGFQSSTTPLPPTLAALPTSTPIGSKSGQTTQASADNLKELIIWVPPQFDPTNDTPASRLLAQHLKTFIDENPGVSITTRVKAVTGPAGLLASLNSAASAAAQAVPALVLLTRPDLETAAAKGLILPIDTLTSVMEEKDWYDYAHQLSAIKGRTYGLPFGGDALVLVYRPTRVAGPPSNWESVARQGQPVIFPAGDRQSLVTINLYLSTGGTLLNEQGQPTIQTQELEKVLKLYYDGLLQNAFPNWLVQYQIDNQALQAYREQKGQWLVTWSSNYLAEMPVDSTAATLPPLGAQKTTLTSGWLWGLSDQQPDRRELSIRLAEHLVQAEFLSQWGPLSSSLPVRPTTMIKWNSLTIQNLLNDIINSAVIIPGNDSLNLLGPILQEAAGMVLKRESDPIRASQGALDRLTAPPPTP